MASKIPANTTRGTPVIVGSRGLRRSRITRSNTASDRSATLSAVTAALQVKAMDKVAASMDRRPINSPAIVPLTTRRPRDIFINPLNWYEENGIKLHAGIRANSIDRQAKVVSSGSVVEPYDKLVLAT